MAVERAHVLEALKIVGGEDPGAMFLEQSAAILSCYVFQCAARRVRCSGVAACASGNA
jgi:hypothetical protein